MSVLLSQINDTLSPKMSMPSELAALFRWIDSNGYFVDLDAGRLGFLFPEDKLKAGWTDTERPGGTNIEFAAEGDANLHYWFDDETIDVSDRLCIFAKTGAEGSMAAFWIDDDGKQCIVHMGSGSGSLLCCVLAESAIDFLRLIAIGYDELCWDECFSHPPNHANGGSDLFVHPNDEYNNWLTSNFRVTIPNTASEIVVHPAQMGDTDSPDRFNRWVEQIVG